MTTDETTHVTGISRDPLDGLRAFLDKGNVTLIVRGAPGTGKTGFLFWLMERYRNSDIALWTGAPVSEEKYAKYTFLKDKIVLDTKHTSLSEAIKTINERLRYSNVTGGAGDSHGLANKPTLIVIDGIERVASRCGFSADENTAASHSLTGRMETLVCTFEREFVSGRGATLIIAAEGTPDADRLLGFADGCVTLRRRDIRGRIIREFEIDKLDGHDHRHNMCLITFADGALRFIPKCIHKRTFNAPPGFKPISFGTDTFSTGNADLDALLGGGYITGSFNVFETDNDVPEWVCLSVIYPTIFNFILQNHGVMLSIGGSQTPDRIKNVVVPVAGAESLAKYVRILTPFTQATRQPYVISAHSENSRERLNIWKNAVAQMKTQTRSKTVLDITAFIALEYGYEKTELLRMIDEGVKRVKYDGDIGIGIARSESELASALGSMADNHFRIADINGTYLIYGVKPKTGAYAMIFDRDDATFALQELA